MDLIADLLIYASLFMGKYIYPVLETIALNIGKAKQGTTVNPIQFTKNADKKNTI